MRNFVLAFIAAVNLFVFTGGTAAKIEEIYPLTTIVIETDYITDVVTVEDFNGNQWQFEVVEDWMVDDICSLIMYNNGTEIIYDDQIVKAHYNGWFEGWNNH